MSSSSWLMSPILLASRWTGALGAAALSAALLAISEHSSRPPWPAWKSQAFLGRLGTGLVYRRSQIGQSQTDPLPR